MISEKRKLFQEKMKARMPVATMPGLARGIAMRRKAAQCVHPSIRADSMRSPGTSSKKPIITQSTRGSATMRWVRISAE